MSPALVAAINRARYQHFIPPDRAVPKPLVITQDEPVTVPVVPLPDERTEIALRMEALRKELESLGDQYHALTQRRMDSLRPKIDDIQRAVGQHYSIGRVDMLSNRRTATIVRPRQIAMWLCRKLTTRSLPEIGRHFGGRDHTTILYSARKIEADRQVDPSLDAELNELIVKLVPENSPVASEFNTGDAHATVQPD